MAVIALGGRTFAPMHQYRVNLARVGSLKEGAIVHLGGRDVGFVNAIAFGTGVLQVDIAVRQPYRRYIRRNSEFYVGMGGRIMGEPSLEIGPPRGEPGPELQPGEVVRGID